MKQPETYNNLANNLRSALGILELDKTSQLYRDATLICNYLENPNFRIAVFGPFNYGKSTLLNAMLGQRTLPIDLIPTTGAAIRVKYGEELQTRITLKDGREIREQGTDILKQFAILDDNRRMREDVAEVEVFCHHPFLQTGVEFLDLPGTNDREEQDNLVRDQLLSADLVIQLLDARKLMTLGERENLRDWLLDRGIKTVVFVVNFLNLMEPDEQKQIYSRLRFVAESFRSDLPDNFSNLYRVDALPALRARLKGDASAIQTTGLSAFESALQSIAAIQKEKSGGYRVGRVDAIATNLTQSLQAKIQTISTELEAAQTKHNTKIQIQQKAEKLIKQGFETSLTELRNWLSLSTLLNRYQSEAAAALGQNQFKTWSTEFFQPALVKHQQEIVKWVQQACEFFNQESPGDLIISLPTSPEISLPSPPTNKPKIAEDLNDAPVAVAAGLGWVLGGPVGAAVVGGAAYLLNRNVKQDKPNNSVAYQNQAAQICADAAQDYLTRFSNEALTTLIQYEETAQKVINFQIPAEPIEITNKRYQQNLLHNCLENLQRELEAVKRSLA
ncbi:dynamin family protein [Microseira wollei]|nr:dynamin family protein [Microseira wollei]